MIRLCAPTDEVAPMIDDAIKAMKENGVLLAEIRDVNNINVLEFSDEQATEFYTKLNNNGIKVWAISSPVGKRDFLIPFEDFQARVKKAIHMAILFHTNNIRVFSFFNHNNNRLEVFKRLQYAVDEAKKHGINVCIENEKDSYGETAENVLDILDNVKGILSVYDSSNFIQKGELSEKTLRMVFPRAYYVHFKDGVHKNNDAEITPVGEGEANIAKLLSMIHDDKVLSIEHHLKFADKDHKYEEIKNDAKFVYHNVTEAFVDATLHARKMLKEAGYKEISTGSFTK